MFTLWPTTLIPESFAGGRGFRPASLISAAETEPLDDPPDDDEGTKLSLEVFRLGLLLERIFSWLGHPLVAIASSSRKVSEMVRGHGHGGCMPARRHAPSLWFLVF